MTFNRTLSGKIAKFQFYKIPIIWVEGPTDLIFFNNISLRVKFRIEAADGKEECKKLANALYEHDYPYIVIIDGDYNVLENRRSIHRRIIKLNRYSMENYLFEEIPLKKVCCNYARIDQNEKILCDEYKKLTESINRSLYKLILLDIAVNKSNKIDSVLPKNVGQLFNSDKNLEFSENNISEIISKYEEKIDDTFKNEVESMLINYLKYNRLVDIISGHLVFQFIRRLITLVILKRKGKKPVIDNDGLLQLLSAEIWHNDLPNDHKKLRKKLYWAIHDVNSYLNI